MYEVLIGCSACEAEIEAVVETVEEAERLACECGAGYVIEAITEIEAVPAPRVRVRLRAVDGEGGERTGSADLRHAA